MEKTLIVALNLKGENREISIEASMEELKELVIAAGGEVEAEVVQNKDTIDATYYIGKGKASEIKNAAEELDIDTVVFNNELSGAQIRNLEKEIDRKIIDRTSLILDIFANRASSSEGKLQVELAQLKYRLPRLVGYGNYLSRQAGGIGTRGPGEQKLEIDRRTILTRINDIEKKLENVEKIRETKRKRRLQSRIPIIAIIGYTNSGKSTLLNAMIVDENDDESKKVFTKDMLFATLDTSLRQGELPSGREVIITDTVGFVSDLPTKLVEAFKGTLEEIKYADILIHVLDMTNKDLEIQMKTTLDILEDIEALDKPTITVLNKCDKVENFELVYDIPKPNITISAKENINIDKLLSMIEANLTEGYEDIKIKIPYSESDMLSELYDDNDVGEVKYHEDGIIVEVKVDKKMKSFLEKYIYDQEE